MGKGFICAENKLPAKAKNSRLMNRLLKNKRISSSLNQFSEKKAFYDELKKIGKDGLYTNEVREFADRLSHRHETKLINPKEARQVARGLQEELYPGLKMYKPSRPEAKNGSNNKTIQSKSSMNAGSPRKNSSKLTPMEIATIMNKTRTKSLSSQNKMEPENKYSSFYDAMKSVRRNQRK